MKRNEIYIGGVLVDSYEDISIASLNFSVADLKDPDKRNTSYSKTIVLPGSKANNKLFGHIYNISKESLENNSNRGINFAPDFNPNLKADIKIYTDGLLQFNGYVQLLDIKIDEKGVQYEVAAFGTLANLFTSIEGFKLTDLDFSEYDHVFNKTNQKNSWATSIKKNGADYVNFSAGLPIGEGYVYPLIDYGYLQQPSTFEVLHLYPAIYVKNYVDKIFALAGFTYTSSFFTSDFFKKLIIPFSGQVIKLSPDQIEQRKFLANTPNALSYSYTDDQNLAIFPTAGFVLFTNDSTGSAFDPSNVYNPTNGAYTVNRSGQYEIGFTMNVRRLITPPATATRMVTQVNQIVLNIINVTTGQVITYDQYASNAFDWTQTIQCKAPAAFYNQGDVIKCRAYYRSVNARFFDASNNIVTGSYTSDLTINATGTTFYNNPIANPVTDGETMQVNSSIPKEVLIKDFMLSIIRMFNLYVVPDANNETNLIIEPQVDFFTGNSVVDWTDKLDLSSQIEIKPVSQIEGKQYVFGYKQDKDYWNDYYFNRWNKVYGTRDLTINNDFVKGVRKMDLIFSPTPTVGNSIYNNMAIPKIIKGREDGGQDPTTGNIRILIYGGVKNITVGAGWSYIGASGTTIETTYPYAGHVDDPYNPTIDLLFDVPDEIYWGSAATIGSNYTNNNLYNKYHKQFIEEITDKDSKIVIAYFRLRPIDIFQLDFRNYIHVDGINYRLNKIIDHDPLREGVTKVELAKIKRGVAFEPINVIVIDPGDNVKKFQILEGGLDEVRDLMASSYYNLVEGGLDEVIDIGATSPTKIINGGQD